MTTEELVHELIELDSIGKIEREKNYIKIYDNRNNVLLEFGVKRKQYQVDFNQFTEINIKDQMRIENLMTNYIKTNIQDREVYSFDVLTK